MVYEENGLLHSRQTHLGMIDHLSVILHNLKLIVVCSNSLGIF